MREKIATIDGQMKANTWASYRNGDELLAGDSMIRDIDPSKLVQIKVFCHSGASIEDITSDLDKLRKSTPYKTLTLMVGTNDIDKADGVTIDGIVGKYKALIEKAQYMASEIKVSSICPRRDRAKENVAPLNAGLVALCGEMDKCTFINHDPSFTLGDGTMNEGFLIDDGPHLTKAGTNKVANNLGLTMKPGHSDVTKAHNKGRMPQNNRRKWENTDRNDQRASVVTPNIRPAPRDNDKHGYYPNTGGWIQHGHQRGNQRGSWKHPHQQGGRDESANGYANTSDYRDRHSAVSMDYLRTRDYRGRCYNCWEDGHSQSDCRHGQPIVCRRCNSYGHKEKDCY